MPASEESRTAPLIVIKSAAIAIYAAGLIIMVAAGLLHAFSIFAAVAHFSGTQHAGNYWQLPIGTIETIFYLQIVLSFVWLVLISMLASDRQNKALTTGFIGVMTMSLLANIYLFSNGFAAFPW